MSFSGFKDEAAHQTIGNDGFFPDLSTSTLVEAYRVPPNFAVATLAVQLRLAMAWANRQLAAWQAAQVAAGHSTLAAVPAARLGDESVLETYYRAAVFNECRALLVQESKVLVRRQDAANQATESTETEAAYHEQAVKALADMQGHGRVFAELI
jgi:hypothetical protein